MIGTSVQGRSVWLPVACATLVSVGIMSIGPRAAMTPLDTVLVVAGDRAPADHAAFMPVEVMPVEVVPASKPITTIDAAMPEVAAMQSIATGQPRDARATSDEAQLRTAFGGAGDITVACTVTLCQVQGTMPAMRPTIETMLSPALIERVEGLGYSPGPGSVAQTPRGRSFVLFLNRET